MAEGSSRGSLKRSFVEDDESSKPPPEKRIRFPKGKKVKKDDKLEIKETDALDKSIPVGKSARLAARDRAVFRNIEKELKEEYIDNDTETFGFATDVRKAEVEYEDNEAFNDEGVTVEPFNLDKEREEGYFDENGNYVEYMNQNEIKDAWLDSVDLYEKHVRKSSVPINTNEKPSDLSTEDLAEISRRIADALEPGETRARDVLPVKDYLIIILPPSHFEMPINVLRALRRLKGSTDKRQKMSAETKLLFDQLTEDAMKLMENGDYNVYDEKQEHFEREAEGYEKVVRARNLDMFGDDEETAAEIPATTGSVESSGDMHSDYVYDESSGYYYNSSLGYYYDSSSGLYGSAATGKWYSYNVESGAYDEVHQDMDTNAAELHQDMDTNAAEVS